MEKTTKKTKAPQNDFEISKEIYIYTIAVLFIISMVAAGIYWSRDFGANQAATQRRVVSLKKRLDLARIKNSQTAINEEQLKKEGGEMFVEKNLNIDAINSYFFNNFKNYPPFNIKDVKKMEYVDLNNDGQYEVAAVLNTKLSHLAEIGDSETIIKPENADEDVMIEVIGVFKLDADKLWSPLYLDYISMPIFSKEGDLPKSNGSLPVLSRIEATDREINLNETKDVITEITVEKKYSPDKEYAYKLIFTNSELTKKERLD